MPGLLIATIICGLALFEAVDIVKSISDQPRCNFGMNACAEEGTDQPENKQEPQYND